MPNEDDKATDLSKYFGAVKMHDDGLKIQREIRNEWDYISEQEKGIAELEAMLAKKDR